MHCRDSSKSKNIYFTYFLTQIISGSLACLTPPETITETTTETTTTTTDSAQSGCKNSSQAKTFITETTLTEYVPIQCKQYLILDHYSRNVKCGYDDVFPDYRNTVINVTENIVYDYKRPKDDDVSPYYWYTDQNDAEDITYEDTTPDWRHKIKDVPPEYWYSYQNEVEDVANDETIPDWRNEDVSPKFWYTDQTDAEGNAIDETSPDWRHGNDWYRILPPAGIKHC